MNSVSDYLGHLYSRPMGQWDALEWFLINLALFTLLALLIPGNRKQRLFRRDMMTDGLYALGAPFLYGPAFQLIATFFVSFGAVRFIQSHWGLRQMPLLLQALFILLLTDFLQYWLHRLFHNAPFWKFHAVHHSAKQVDWLTSVRFHPVNFVIYSTSVNALVATLGFSPEAFIFILPFNVIYSPLVHANLNWDYGPFKYVLASPVFHRWHHTHPHEGGNKNFAATFSFLDAMFGTFYMPEGQKPEIFGAPHDANTGNFFQQLAYPFLRRRAVTPHNTEETLLPPHREDHPVS